MHLPGKLFEVIPSKDVGQHLCPDCVARSSMQFHFEGPTTARTLYFCECQKELVTVDGGGNHEKVLVVYDVSYAEFRHTASEGLKLMQQGWHG